MYSRVYVEITNICNRNCSFCPGTMRKPRRMTLEEFTQIAEKLQGVTRYIYYHLMGEPLTHPLLPEMIRVANARGFRSAITTNGTLLPQRGAELIDAGVYKVNISVHSFEQGSLDAYLSYLNGCMDFAEQASKAGVLVILRLWNNGVDEGRNVDIVERLKARFPEPWHWGSRGARIHDKLHLEYGDRFRWPDMTAEDQGDQVFCYGLKDHFGVLCDGSVVPCCLDHEGDITLGNLFTQDAEEILHSPRAEAMRKGFACRHATEELCQRCGYARRFG